MAPDTQSRRGRVAQRPRAAMATPPGGVSTMFHEGERAVQRRAGVERAAAQVGRNIMSFVPAEFGEFLGRQPFVVVASLDQSGHVWASLLAGGAGFARVLDDRRILLASLPTPGDPLEAALELPQTRIGVLAIDLGTRQRIRLNGAAQRTSEGILLTVVEAFGNCTKFIQRRRATGQLTRPAAASHRKSAALDTRQVALARRADTFFIASAHPETGADASHRGGRQGFIEVADGGRKLTFPDYGGNRMFQTLGNLTVNPRTGLLLLDWETGSTLQMTGRAQIVWDAQAIRSRPGAERLVEVRLDTVHEHPRAMPARWRLIEPYARNPPVNP
jgi:predicted pyridoxine 5'-phosphate oxidase superfamily flavin-nucleotide-binding protein